VALALDATDTSTRRSSDLSDFPKPEAVPAADPWDNAREKARAEALQQIVDTFTPDAVADLADGDDALVRRAIVTVLVDGADDELAKRARNAVIQACAADPATVLDALEGETVDAVWSRVMTATAHPGAVGLGTHFRTAGVKRLRAVAVLDPSDRKREAALDTFVTIAGLDDVDEAELEQTSWIPDFIRERLLSDESDYVRATLATRLATATNLDAALVTLGRQWLKYTELTPPSLQGDDEWEAVEIDPDFFAAEKRPLLAHPHGVRTTRSRAAAGAPGAAEEGRRSGGPTLVQGHRNQAGPLVRLQQGLAILAVLVALGLWLTGRIGPLAGVGLAAAGLVWAGALQLWKWYRYG
jgi:hypothetical protein